MTQLAARTNPGAGRGNGQAEVPRICAEFDEIIGAFGTWRLDHIKFPYVHLDATYLHVPNAAAQVTSLPEEERILGTGTPLDGSGPPQFSGPRGS